MSTTSTDLNGKPFACGDRMSKRQYFSQGGPGWDTRMAQDEYNFLTDEVDNDEPWPQPA